MLRRYFSADRKYYRFFSNILGVVPRNIDLYKLALVHRSASVVLEDGGVVNNERLEFLGDAVLQAISSDMVFLSYPEFSEGEMTRLRSRIVGAESLYKMAKELGLDDAMITVPSGLAVGQSAIVGDCMEAVIGALYLDRGFDVAYRAVERLIRGYLDVDVLLSTEQDFKSRVLEWGQRERVRVEFVSKVLYGVDGLESGFETVLYVDGEEVGRGGGRSKKKSEQSAAEVFFESEELGNEE